jgi:hypothetical protein
MSRVSSGGPIEISATNNIYTVLVGAAVVVVLVALIVLCVRYNSLFQAWPWAP